MIRFLLLLPLLCLVSCSKPRDVVTEHRAHIAETLGGLKVGEIEQVQPPVGPFRLYHKGSYYYRATSAAGEFYVETYVSSWTIATVVVLQSDEPIYRYDYWQQTKVPLLGSHWSKVTR